MPDFSIIQQSPQIRQIVQENMLERQFHDALFPRTLFRGEVTPMPWAANVGDTRFFSGTGLIPIDASPLQPGNDPVPLAYTYEQWFAQAEQYMGTIDTYMPNSVVAIANLFLRNAHQLGLQSALTLDTIVRDRMFNAAVSGWSVVDGAQSSTANLRVKRLNGYTRARNPNLSTGSPVRFDYVSSSNPLVVHIFDNGADATFSIIGYTPDVAGDETGPGVLILSTSVTSVANRAYIYSVDSTDIVRVGGGLKVDTLLSTSLPKLTDIRSAVSNFWQNNVPEHPDGRFHAHISPISQSKVFADDELQRLLTALPDYYMYKKFAIGELLGCVFFRNSRNPIASTVNGGSTATYLQTDPFAGELYTKGVPTSSDATSLAVYRMLFTAQGGIMEYYIDPNQLITDAGITGKVGDPRVVNNGIEVNSDRIQLILRAPQNRAQDMVATTWKFIGDWPVRTDAATGDPSRYKRFQVIEHT